MDFCILTVSGLEPGLQYQARVRDKKTNTLVNEVERFVTLGIKVKEVAEKKSKRKCVGLKGRIHLLLMYSKSTFLLCQNLLYKSLYSQAAFM